MSAQACYTAPKSTEWGTPQDFFDSLDAEFGFTLDVAADADNAKCAKYFTVEDDGLAQDWGRETCWMNPPYGREIPRWMRKAYESSLAGATVVCLVPARTETNWWWDYATKGETRFVKGRLNFTGGSPTNPESHNAPFPVAVVVFRPPINLRVVLEVANLRATGDRMQSEASRLAEFVLALDQAPYEVHMAAIEAANAVEDWTEIRRESVRC